MSGTIRRVSEHQMKTSFGSTPRDTALRDSILGSIEHLWTSVRNK